MNEIDLRSIDLNLLVVFDVLMEEGGVTRAAERLGRTQSAVSHALARLRGQLGDPVLLRSGGKMKPSPFALALAQDVKPILRNIRRVLTPPSVFDAATTERTFRIAAPDFSVPVFVRLLATLAARAPRLTIEWVAPREPSLLEVADGRIDLAFAPADLRLPDDIAREAMGEVPWRTYARRGHPAVAAFDAAAWAAFPHLVVNVENRLRSPVEAAAAAAGLARRVGIVVPNFAAVAPLLAATDLLATLPATAMFDAAVRYDLVSRPVPFAMPPFRHALVWSRRNGNDAAILWLRRSIRSAVRATFGDVTAA